MASSVNSAIFTFSTLSSSLSLSTPSFSSITFAECNLLADLCGHLLTQCVFQSQIAHRETSPFLFIGFSFGAEDSFELPLNEDEP